MATLKDVALRAGVGLGTASRVVSGKGAVSPKTLARVQKAIEELEFHPSYAARSLMMGSSQMIGVYIPYLSGTFYTPILQLIYSELRAAGLNMVVGFGIGSSDERIQAIEGIDFLKQRGCDGVIVMSNVLRDEDITALGPRKSRLVLLNHSLPSISNQSFTVDHELGGRMAAQALLAEGHRDIAVIAGPRSAPDNIERIDGFMDELAKAGIDTDGMWVVESDFAPKGGWAAARELSESGYPFSAVFCANDDMAMGALSFFQQAGVDVPGQISVLGYDDTNSAEYTAPRLSTVHMPWTEMTLNGLNCLLNRCYGTDRPVTHDYPVSVAMRASLGKAPAGSSGQNDRDSDSGSKP